MGVISVSVRSDKRGLERLARSGPAAEALARDRAATLGDDIRRHYPRSNPLPQGRERHSADLVTEARRGPYDWAVELPEVPSRFLIEGTRPHEIAARGGGVLRFVAGGRTVFARNVHHPGTSANDFVEQAVRAAMPGVLSRVRALFGGGR